MRAAGLALAVLVLLPLVLPAAEAQTAKRWTFESVAALDAAVKRGDITGSGTPSRPYVLAHRDIPVAEEGGIVLRNIRAHVVIQDVRIHAVGSKLDGISLQNVSNVTIERVSVEPTRYGIHLQDVQRVVVRDSTVRASQVGILLEGRSSAQVYGNDLAVNDRNVAFLAKGASAPTGSLFRANNLSVATGQFGFHFDGVASFSQDIDESNVVNFVPVRWHADLHGTELAPRSIVGEQGGVRGVTNVGQIVCFNCSHVRFVNAEALAGQAGGLVIERSANVTIRGGLAGSNDGAGIAIRNSSRVNVSGATLEGNGVGLLGTNTTGLVVDHVTAHANQVGILLQEGGAARATSPRILGVVAEGNARDGILLHHVRNASVRASATHGNGLHGLRLDDARNASVLDHAAEGNGRAGIALVNATTNASVRASRAVANGGGGILLASGAQLSEVVGNTISANGEAGLWLHGAGLGNRIASNALSDERRHVRLTQSEDQTIEDNTMSAGRDETGLWFDDERSYNNRIATSNRVGRSPVHFYVGLVGSSDAPVELRGIAVAAPNVTNVGQVVVYRSSYVHLVEPAASHGARGIYALRSSSVRITDATLAHDRIGIELQGTQTALLEGIVAADVDVAVLVGDGHNVTVRDVTAPGARVAVKFNDTRSRGGLVERVNATGVRDASVLDPSAVGGRPQHLIADAGLDKLVGVGQNVSFADALGVARHGSDRIRQQRWDLGDGASAASADERTLRPIHAYAAPGRYVATYTLETSGGLVLTDTAVVRVVGAPQPPAQVTPLTHAKRVALEWPIPESETPVRGYRVYRGTSAEDLVLLLETVNNATTVEEKFATSLQVFYAVSAVGLGGESELSPLTMLSAPTPPTPTAAPSAPTPKPRPKPTPTPAPTEDAETPGAPLALVAVALLAAALARRRDGRAR